MKPLATLNRPVMKTVDIETKEETVSFKERTDTTSVPAMGVVAETTLALVLADEALRKFGGDTVAELVRNHRGYLASLRACAETPPARTVRNITRLPDRKTVRKGKTGSVRYEP